MLSDHIVDEQYERFLKKHRSPGFFEDPGKIESVKKVTVSDHTCDRSLSARVFPNGEFGIGFVPHRGISARERRYDADRRYADMNTEIVPDVQISPDGESFIYGRKIIPGSPPPKLGIGTDLSQPRKKYGLKGITGHGRKMLRNAGHIFDVVSRSGRGYLPQMGTLTIPSLEPERMKIIAQRWHDITRRFYQECRRRYARFGKVFDYASCTEIQPERWETRREVGLHLHFLFVSFRVNKRVWSLPDGWVRRVWRRVVVRYVGEENVPDNLNYRREAVRESSAGYIAKYASKGTEFIEEVSRTMGEEYIPSRWWSISKRLGDCIRRHTISSQGAIAEMILAICTEDMSEYLKYKRCITMLIETTEYAKSKNCPQEIVFGYGGMFTRVGAGLFQPPDFAASIREYMLTALDKKHSS